MEREGRVWSPLGKDGIRYHDDKRSITCINGGSQRRRGEIREPKKSKQRRGNAKGKQMCLSHRMRQSKDILSNILCLFISTTSSI